MIKGLFLSQGEPAGLRDWLELPPSGGLGAAPQNAAAAAQSGRAWRSCSPASLWPAEARRLHRRTVLGNAPGQTDLERVRFWVRAGEDSAWVDPTWVMNKEEVWEP